jgi:hypothetical protein
LCIREPNEVELLTWANQFFRKLKKVKLEDERLKETIMELRRVASFLGMMLRMKDTILRTLKILDQEMTLSLQVFHHGKKQITLTNLPEFVVLLPLVIVAHRFK